MGYTVFSKCDSHPLNWSFWGSTCCAFMIIRCSFVNLTLSLSAIPIWDIFYWGAEKQLLSFLQKPLKEVDFAQSAEGERGDTTSVSSPVCIQEKLLHLDSWFHSMDGPNTCYQTKPFPDNLRQCSLSYCTCHQKIYLINYTVYRFS